MNLSDDTLGQLRGGASQMGFFWAILCKYNDLGVLDCWLDKASN